MFIDVVYVSSLCVVQGVCLTAQGSDEMLLSTASLMLRLKVSQSCVQYTRPYRVYRGYISI
jgi:hypothetical protein